MSKERIVFLLGLWVALLALPILGFPRSWKDFFFILSGLGIMCISYLMNRERTRNTPKGVSMTATYAEHKPTTPTI
ncbi:MAG: hypothetical protein WC795_00735 [Candidatus Paceibacterota bacterium]